MSDGRLFGVTPPPASVRDRFSAFEVARFVILPSALAWAIILALPFFGGPTDICTARSSGQDIVSRYLVPQLLWLLMISAMMVPLAAPQIKILAARSRTARRGRSVVLFLLGFVSLWMCAGLCLTIVADIIGWPRSGDRMGLSALYFTAAMWQLSDLKRRALNRCHHVAPARSLGRTADRDAFRNGVLHARYCVSSCFLTMAPLSVTRLGPTAMLAVFAILLAERADHTAKFGLSAFVLLLMWMNEML
ncbi:copper chaperone [Bradyrhizobium sp. CCBAU 45394]|uniref:copper chaperone n=1 Tax=Bradyrhizobium sp. CCBAU 45394 TaxID=1325087 RepID=UPI003FA431DC